MSPLESNTNVLRAWQERILQGVLQGILGLWLLGLLSGMYNLIQAYRHEVNQYPNSLLSAIAVGIVYLGTTALLLLANFDRRLGYTLRAALALFVLYILGATGLILASLSGDGRIFFFAFVILTAVLFDLRASLLALALSMATMAGIGTLQVSQVLLVPAERQINATDATAWMSGSLVFLTLSLAVLISSSLLLHALADSLNLSEQSRQREIRLSRLLRTLSLVNQLIVREKNISSLLQQTCEILVGERGYSFACIGLLQNDGVTLKLVASAGNDALEIEKIAVRLDQEQASHFCAATALNEHKPVQIEATPENDLCLLCPCRSRLPYRRAIALPLIREGNKSGTLVIEQGQPSTPFGEEETRLLQELADDLAYAISTLDAEERQRSLSEAPRAFLALREMDALWSLVIETVQQILRADRAAIFLYDRLQDRLSCLRSFGLSEEYINELNRRFHEVPGSHLITDPQPVLVNDILTDPATASLRPAMIREGFRAYAVFPIFSSQGIVAAFVAYRNGPFPFSLTDMTLGQILVNIVGTALENLRLQTETRARASELGVLYAATMDMSASLLDSPALLETLARHMTEAVGATSGYISSIDLSNASFTVLAEYWARDASAPEWRSDLNRVYLRDDYPTSWRAIQSGKTIVLHEDSENLSAAERWQFQTYGVRSILYVPILSRGQPFGLIEIWESRRKREFTLAEIRIAQAMASHAGSIIENARLFESLRASEMRYRTLVEQASDGIFIADAEQRYVEVNSAGCQMLGYSRQEILSMRMEDLVLPEDLASNPFKMEDLQQGKTVIAERRLKRKDGTLLPVEISAKILPNGYFQGIMRDITERKQAEAALKQSEAYFRALFDNSAEGMAILDAEGKFVYVSPAEQRLTGYTPEETLGQSAFRYIHPEDLPRLLQTFRQGMQTPGSIATLEYRIQRKDGQWRTFEVTAHNMLSDPYIRGIVINYRDITERKQAEEALLRRAHELETLVDASIALRSAQSVAEMVPILARHALRAVEGDYASIFLLEARTNEYVSQGWFGRSPKLDLPLLDEKAIRHKAGEGITGHVAQTGEIYLAPELQSDPFLRILNGEETRLQRMQSAISLPMRAQENIIGVLNLWMESPRTFTETEIQLLTALAETGGNAIYRAMLYEQTEQQARELAEAYDSTLAGWARALELRDELTEGHTRRVTQLTLQLARALGVPERDLIHIRRGALLHDIGKMGIPDAILHKPGPLTEQEQRIMRLHPQYAYEMLSAIPFLKDSLDIPYCHHEHWDGSGYPRGLKGEEIPLAARIFTVVDNWDAITSNRPYRPAWPKEKARQYLIEQAGKIFDPRIVEVFLKLNPD
ncbi:MAG: GAF domain-containing protein [Anaerolineae bacterium]